MRTVLCLLLASLVGLSGAAASPQRAQGDDSDTAEFAREARETARRFAERLRETRDFGPLIDELFAERFLECHGRAMLEGKENGIFSQTGAPRPPSGQVRAAELRRRLVVWLNFFHLKTLQRLSAGRESPPGVSDLLTQNAADELTTLERAASTMREHFTAHPPEETEAYRQNMRLVGEKEHDRKFWEVAFLRIPDEEAAEAGRCFGLSGRTLAVVKVPPFYQIFMARNGKRLELVTLLCTEPPCVD